MMRLNEKYTTEVYMEEIKKDVCYVKIKEGLSDKVISVFWNTDDECKYFKSMEMVLAKHRKDDHKTEKNIDYDDNTSIVNWVRKDIMDNLKAILKDRNRAIEDYENGDNDALANWAELWG